MGIDLTNNIARYYKILAPNNFGTVSACRKGDALVAGSILIDIDAMDGDNMACSIDGAPYYLIYNPISQNYLLADSEQRLAMHPHNYCQICKCDTLKYICFIISKNGCSCILRSALEYDNIMSTSYSEHVWKITKHDGEGCSVSVFNGERAKAILDDPVYADYKRFIILQDERERFIKFINWTHERGYNQYINLELGKADSFKEHIFLHPYFSKDIFVCDQHALPQSKHVDAIIDQLYGGDSNRFWSEVECVSLDNLQTWFPAAFGRPMLLNNMTAEEYKLYSLDSLTAGEMQSLNTLLKPYELYEQYSR